MEFDPETINNLINGFLRKSSKESEQEMLNRLDRELLEELKQKEAFNKLFVLPSGVASAHEAKTIYAFFADRPQELRGVGAITRLAVEDPEINRTWQQTPLIDRHAAYMQVLSQAQTIQIGRGTLWGSISSNRFPNNSTNLDGFRIIANRG